jgi:hypothetical protein
VNHPETIIAMSDGAEYGAPTMLAELNAQLQAAGGLTKVELAYNEGEVWINPVQVTTVRGATEDDFYEDAVGSNT